MDYIDSASTGMRHALDTWEQRGANGKGKTWCGRTVTGQTGGCIAEMIECKRCRKAMKREGWTIN